jgi:cyclic pyranopterin phosphate synthase
MIHLPHLETNVTAACQNRCVACNHFVPMQVAQFKLSMISQQQMKRDLEIFARFVHVSAYGMLGGEPTLHPELPELIYIAEMSGIADKIELWTNGQTLHQQRPAFWKVMRGKTIVMSVYPGKMTDEHIASLVELCTLEGVELHVKDERRYPNFTQLLKDKDSGPAETQATYNACWFKTFSRVLDNGYFYRCCTSPYIPKLLQGRPEGSDGLRVDESLTEAAIQSFLDQPTAMASCTICAGRNTPSAFPIPWSEIKDPAAWLKASSGRQ